MASYVKRLTALCLLLLIFFFFLLHYNFSCKQALYVAVFCKTNKLFLAAIIFLHILQVMDYSDTDVAEYLYKSKSDLDSLKSFLCKDLTKVCSKAPPPVPKVMSSFMTLTSKFIQHLNFCAVLLLRALWPQCYLVL